MQSYLQLRHVELNSFVSRISIVVWVWDDVVLLVVVRVVEIAAVSEDLNMAHFGLTSMMGLEKEMHS